MSESAAPGASPKKIERHDPELVARLCERVYRSRLGADADRMVADDGDGGDKLRRRAMSYEATVRATLEALKGEPLGGTINTLLDAGQKMTGMEAAS